ncbi:MAG: cytochrome c family protein [Pseudomonadota bacterium]
MAIPSFNTIAMGVLFALFVALGLNFLAEKAFYVKKPEVKGYKIEVADASGEGADAPVEEAKPIGVVLASADASAGEKVARRCVACHSFDEGGANKVGPALYDIVNRPMGNIDGFNYSSALVAYGEGKTWTYEELYGFLKKPGDWIDGTSMGFAGLNKQDDRANLIAYMRSLSPEPAPLPPAE